MIEVHMYYAQLGHGALLFLALDDDHAQRILHDQGIEEEELQSPPVRLPDVTYVTDDNGFQWMEA